MSDKLNISALQHPEDILAEQGEYALFGLYVRVYWQYMEEMQAHESAMNAVMIEGTIEEKQKLDRLMRGRDEAYEEWLKWASETLPEWAIDILAEIDNALDIADGQGME